MPENLPQKTPKGIEEVRNKTYKLSPKLRNALILVDGTKSLSVLVEQVEKLGLSEQAIRELAKEGFITGVEDPAKQAEKKDKQAEIQAKPENVIDAAKSFIREYLLKVLGEDAKAFLVEVEQAKTKEELLQQAQKCRTLIHSFEGSEKAETLWQMVQGLLK